MLPIGGTPHLSQTIKKHGRNHVPVNQNKSGAKNQQLNLVQSWRKEKQRGQKATAWLPLKPLGAVVMSTRAGAALLSGAKLQHHRWSVLGAAGQRHQTRHSCDSRCLVPLSGHHTLPAPKYMRRNIKTKLYPPLAGCAGNSLGVQIPFVSPGRGSIPPQGGCWGSSRSGKLKGRMLEAAPAAPPAHSLQHQQNLLFANLCLYSFSGFPTAAQTDTRHPAAGKAAAGHAPNRCHNPPRSQQKVCTSSRTPALILTIATRLRFFLTTRTVSNSEESSFHSVAGDAGETKPG